MNDPARTVLVVTGALSFTSSGWGLLRNLRERVSVLRSRPWFALGVKLVDLEYTLLSRLHRATPAFRKRAYGGAVDAFFAPAPTTEGPLLTEVALASSLEDEGLRVEVATYAELASSRLRREAALSRADTLFLSTTYFDSFEDLERIVGRLARPHHRVVAGGAWVSLAHDRWRPVEGVDVVAIGYGELLVPALARWIESGYQALRPPANGRLKRVGPNVLVYSGSPDGKSLDGLPAPDWSVARRLRGRSLTLARYESVRGCPYRCGYCNYPFLFDDHVFRMRSAEQVVADWGVLAQQGFTKVDVVDSLFTMPKRRIERICALLLEQGIELSWTCYARADDLLDLDTCRLLARAGCERVFIGVETGSQVVLDNMNKRCTVERNARAIENAKAAGIAVTAGIIVGYPGDSHPRVEETLAFLRRTRPDRVAVVPFSVSSERIPVLDEGARARFGLETRFDAWRRFPHWRHDTMDAAEAVVLTRWLIQRIKEERLALVSNIVFRGVMDGRDAEAAPLLEFQRDLAVEHRWVQRLFDLAHASFGAALRRQIEGDLGPRRERADAATAATRVSRHTRNTLPVLLD